MIPLEHLDNLADLDAAMDAACRAERVDVCACCGNLAAGHGHFALYCELCADRPLHNCDHGQAA